MNKNEIDLRDALNHAINADTTRVCIDQQVAIDILAAYEIFRETIRLTGTLYNDVANQLDNFDIYHNTDFNRLMIYLERARTQL